jgi:hypothetical protein
MPVSISAAYVAVTVVTILANAAVAVGDLARVEHAAGPETRVGAIPRTQRTAV